VDRAAAEAAGGLLGLLPYVEQDNVYERILPFLESPDRQAWAVLGTLAGTDGKVSMATVHSGGVNFAFGDGSVRAIFRNFTENVERALELGVNGENWMQLPGVSLGSPATAPGVFSFAALARLTEDYVADAKLQADLLRMLRQAEQAAGQGHPAQKERWLAEYVDSLQKARGMLLPAVQTDALILIARAL